VRISDWSSDVCSSDLLQNFNSYLQLMLTTHTLLKARGYSGVLAASQKTFVDLISRPSQVEYRPFLELKETLTTPSITNCT